MPFTALRAAGRARRLSDLEAALNLCERLHAEVVQNPSCEADAVMLHRRIQAVRLEIDRLRRALPLDPAEEQPDALWNELATWKGNRWI